MKKKNIIAFVAAFGLAAASTPAIAGPDNGGDLPTYEEIKALVCSISPWLWYC